MPLREVHKQKPRRAGGERSCLRDLETKNDDKEKKLQESCSSTAVWSGCRCDDEMAWGREEERGERVVGVTWKRACDTTDDLTHGSTSAEMLCFAER